MKLLIYVAMMDDDDDLNIKHQILYIYTLVTIKLCKSHHVCQAHS